MRCGLFSFLGAAFRAAGRPGSRAAGQQGSRAAGRRGGGAAGRPGSRAACDSTSHKNGPPSHRTPRPLSSIAPSPNPCSAGDSEQTRPYWRWRAGGHAGRRTRGQAGRRTRGHADTRTRGQARTRADRRTHARERAHARAHTYKMTPRTF
jgi:hypothetical protein